MGNSVWFMYVRMVFFLCNHKSLFSMVGSITHHSAINQLVIDWILTTRFSSEKKEKSYFFFLMKSCVVCLNFRKDCVSLLSSYIGPCHFKKHFFATIFCPIDMQIISMKYRQLCACLKRDVDRYSKENFKWKALK